MSHSKQFTLFAHKASPNGWKVPIVLEELNLTYETKYLDFEAGEQKRPEYTAINPNGRIPAIIDHYNNDYTLWDSAAIITYLVTKYDPEHKISAATEEDKFHQLQWLCFHIADQVPYYAQAFYFTIRHPEKLPSAIERYRQEVIRVLGVLDSVFAKKEWLVGGKPSVADFIFITWNDVAHLFVDSPGEPYDFEKHHPHYHAWAEKLRARPSAVKIGEIRAEVNKA